MYENNQLQFILTSEGRIMMQNEDTYEYQYFLKDHLGNTRITLSQNGTVLQEDAYYPFGMNIAGLSYSDASPENKYKYNGKRCTERSRSELEGEFGLDWYDYGARFYDAVLVRWHVRDPLAEKYYSFSSYNYCANNPVLFIDPNGMNLDEFKIAASGQISKVNDNKYYKTEKGEVKALADGESEKGKNMVDKITNSKGKSEYYSEKSISESKANKSDPSTFSNTSSFSNSGEGKDFYKFVANSSNVEWAAGEVNMSDGNTRLFVGTDGSESSTTYISQLENAFGNNLIWASHSHPGSGGPPSYDLPGEDNTKVGDLNSAKRRNLDTKYEVYDIPGRKTWFYDKNSLNLVRRGWKLHGVKNH